MIYAAYFDESNDHERAYCVGGFIGAQLDCVHLEWEDDQDYIVLQVADNLAYEIRKLAVKDTFKEDRPERKAMTRLKERIWKVYKLNYEGLKRIMEEAQSNRIPIDPEIHNPSPLLGGPAKNFHC